MIPCFQHMSVHLDDVVESASLLPNIHPPHTQRRATVKPPTRQSLLAKIHRKQLLAVLKYKGYNNSRSNIWLAVGITAQGSHATRSATSQKHRGC
jgi:hypothetical protein